MAAAPLALGLALGGAARPEAWARALRLAERADALGMHSVWLPEGHFHAGATPSPVVGLAAMAARTHRVRLGTTSLLLTIHHPLRAAADLTTLDHASGGRLVVGLGRGFRPALFAAFAVERGTKRDRFDEALDAILAAWSGAPVALRGPHFGTGEDASVRLALRPLQRPHPPLLVAAFGPLGLRQAARRGLAYLASPLEPLAVLEENQRIWREALPVGTTPPSFPRVPVMRTVFVAADPAEARRVRDALTAEAPRLPRGAPASLRRAAEGGVAARVLVGSAEEVAAETLRYRERLGVDLLVARTEVPGAGPEACERSLERLVRDVLPLVA